MDYTLTIEYGDCDYPMTQEALDFYLGNQPVLVLSANWRVTDGQFQPEPIFHKRERGFSLEFKKYDT